mgnify:CR=1 FL=1
MAIDPITMMAISAGVNIFGGMMQNRSNNRAIRLAEDAQRKAQRRVDNMTLAFANADISNPYANLQNRFRGMRNPYLNLPNTMEDLTINQAQAEFQRRSFERSQANILDSFRGAAGGSGIGTLAQSLAQQGQIAAERDSASIGAQEALNQRLSAQQAGKLNLLEAQGAASVDLRSRMGQSQLDRLEAAGERQTQRMNLNRVGTLLGMAQADLSGYNTELAELEGRGANIAGNTIGGLSNLAMMGLQSGVFGGGTSAGATGLMGGGPQTINASDGMLSMQGGDYSGMFSGIFNQ